MSAVSPTIEWWGGLVLLTSGEIKSALASRAHLLICYNCEEAPVVVGIKLPRHSRERVLQDDKPNALVNLAPFVERLRIPLGVIDEHYCL